MAKPQRSSTSAVPTRVVTPTTMTTPSAVEDAEEQGLLPQLEGTLNHADAL